MSEQTQSTEAQMLAETRRIRQAAEGIRILLTIWLILSVLGAIIIAAYSL